MFVTVNDFLKNDEYKPKCTLFCEFVFKGGVGYDFRTSHKKTFNSRASLYKSPLKLVRSLLKGGG